MNNQEVLLISRYAKAFISVFVEQLEFSDIQSFDDCANYLDKHHSWLFLSNLSLISNNLKEEMIIKICNQYNLKVFFKDLFMLLIRHKRMLLLPDILRKIKIEYFKYHNIHIFKIESSCSLNEIQEEDIKRFLQEQLNGATIVCQYNRKPSLIAGISISSRALRWEKSIKNDVLMLHNAMRC